MPVWSVSRPGVGIVVLIVGVVGVLLSLRFWTSFVPLGRRDVDVHA